MRLKAIGRPKSTLQYCWSMKVSSEACAKTGKGIPRRFEIMMPSVIKIWVDEPKGPFNSIGVTSLMKLGTKTEKPPPLRPKRNLPARTAP